MTVPTIGRSFGPAAADAAPAAARAGTGEVPAPLAVPGRSPVSRGRVLGVGPVPDAAVDPAPPVDDPAPPVEDPALPAADPGGPVDDDEVEDPYVAVAPPAGRDEVGVGRERGIGSPPTGVDPAADVDGDGGAVREDVVGLVLAVGGGRPLAEEASGPGRLYPQTRHRDRPARSRSHRGHLSPMFSTLHPHPSRTAAILLLTSSAIPLTAALTTRTNSTIQITRKRR